MELLQVAGDSLLLLMCLYALKQINDNNRDCREFVAKMTETYLEHIAVLVKVQKNEG